MKPEDYAGPHKQEALQAAKESHAASASSSNGLLFADAKTPKFLLGALRQYRHNDGSDGFLVGLDYDETLKVIARLIESAHMAGQADAGVDPGYSNAQAYCRDLFGK